MRHRVILYQAKILFLILILSVYNISKVVFLIPEDKTRHFSNLKLLSKRQKCQFYWSIFNWIIFTAISAMKHSSFISTTVTHLFYKIYSYFCFMFFQWISRWFLITCNTWLHFGGHWHMCCRSSIWETIFRRRIKFAIHITMLRDSIINIENPFEVRLF